MDGHLAATATVELAGAVAVRAFASRGAACAGRAVRELVDSDFGGHGGAARSPGCAWRGNRASPGKRRLLPGRAAYHDRVVVEERDPDRRVRAQPGSRGQVDH